MIEQESQSAFAKFEKRTFNSAANIKFGTLTVKRTLCEKNTLKGITKNVNITVIEEGEKKEISPEIFSSRLVVHVPKTHSQESRGFLQGSYGLVRFVKERIALLFTCSQTRPTRRTLISFPYTPTLACTCRVNSRDKVVLTSTNDLCALFFVSGNTFPERDTFLHRRIVASPAAVRTHWSESFTFRSLTLLSSRESTRSPSPYPNRSLS